MTIEQHQPAAIVWASVNGTTFRVIAAVPKDNLVDYNALLTTTDKEKLDQFLVRRRW